VSYGAGTRDGPAAIIAASREVELYDREFGSECALEYGVHTLPPLAVTHASPDAMVERVTRAVRGELSRTPAPQVLAVLGGEHGISPGVVGALAERAGEGEFVVVQIDAHADLRPEYQGSTHSHACAARRIAEHAPVFQIGVRNISAVGAAFARDSDRVTTVWAEDAAAAEPAFLEELAAFCRGRRVYLTIDLDGLDPSIMPAVGTPEPGGLSWARTLEIARTVAREAASVPAFDVVELAPVPGLAAPNFLAAKLVYKIMSLAILGGRA
jgi:agmatinase